VAGHIAWGIGEGADSYLSYQVAESRVTEIPGWTSPLWLCSISSQDEARRVSSSDSLGSDRHLCCLNRDVRRRSVAGVMPRLAPAAFRFPGSAFGPRRTSGAESRSALPVSRPGRELAETGRSEPYAAASAITILRSRLSQLRNIQKLRRLCDAEEDADPMSHFPPLAGTSANIP